HGGTEMASNRFERPNCERRVKPHSPAGKAFSVDDARDQLGICDGRLVAAAAVARRTRGGAGTFRADAYDTRRVNARDRAATGPDFDNVDDRDLNRIAGLKPRPFEVVIGLQHWPSITNERAFGRRAADVKVEDVALTKTFSDPYRAGDSSGRSRFDEGERRNLSGAETGDTAVRLHAIARAGESLVGKSRVEISEVA